MTTPIPFVVSGSGDPGDAPEGSIPVNLYGGGGGGGGGPITTDAITVEGFPPEAEVDGMTLNDFLSGIGDGMGGIFLRIEALETLTQTTEAVTIEGVDPAFDGQTLTDFLTELNDDIRDMLLRIGNLESQGGGTVN